MWNGMCNGLKLLEIDEKYYKTECFSFNCGVLLIANYF